MEIFTRRRIQRNLFKMVGLIYKATNIIDGKIYVGQTTVGLPARIKRHLKDCRAKKKTHNYFHRAINKFGIENFKWGIIENIRANTTQELKKILDNKEYLWIKKTNSTNPAIGYNLTEGGGYLPNVNGKLNGMAKRYVFIGPDGKRYKIHGKFKLFCIKNKLIPKTMSRLLTGKTIKSHHKGWQVFYANNFLDKFVLTINPMNINEKFSTASKIALVRTRIGKKLTDAHKRKISINNALTNRKLSDEEIKAIKKMLRARFRNIDVAKKFNMSPSLICNIKNGRTWKNKK